MKSFRVPFKAKRAVLALGPQAKNTLCFIRGSCAYISGVHEDLSRPQDLDSFEQDARYFLKKKPKVIAYDLHPEYQSTKFALGLEPKTYNLEPIQHHHAHIASCMAENGLRNQRVIGVAFDGTGLGEGSGIWGAEFLICNYKSFRRAAHLKEIPLLGGERAILEPWRLAGAWLGNVDFAPRAYRNKFKALRSMQKAGVNSPLASSMGRLFDAAACLILGKYKTAFEAELALALNRLAEKGLHISRKRALAYVFGLRRENNVYIIDPSAALRRIFTEVKSGGDREIAAYRFHLSVARAVQETCLILRRESGLNMVALSGGVFQNNLLLALTLDLLYRERFRVLTQRKLSCNDSGISLGQAAVACLRS